MSFSVSDHLVLVIKSTCDSKILVSSITLLSPDGLLLFFNDLVPS